MDTVLLVARLGLAAVFVVAGLAKLADRQGSRQALVDFGVPGVLAAPLGILLPLVELGVGVALIPTTSAWWGAIGALALLLLFVSGIGVNLALGRRPECRCFGQLQSAPAGWRTLVRDGALAGVAGFVVWQGRTDPGPSAVGWFADLRTAELLGVIGGTILVAFAVIGSAVLINVMRQNGRLLLRLESLESRLEAAGLVPALASAESQAPAETGLPIGVLAPAFTLPGLHGETLTLDSLRAARKPVMLVFSDPECGPCAELMPEIARWQREHARDLRIALISKGTQEANRTKATQYGVMDVLVQSDREIEEAYHATGTPTALLVNVDGTVASRLAPGADEIRALLGRALGMAAPGESPEVPPPPADPLNGSGNGQVAPTPVAAKIGDPVPPLKLHDLRGRKVNLARIGGRPTLLLFWDPRCGFCSQMLEDVKAWEADPPKGTPKLLVVSTGTLEENRAMGLRSTVVLDTGFRAGKGLGANGTPSAVLIDANGRIASEVAAGATAVLALAGVQQGSSQPSSTQAVPGVGDPAPSLELPDLRGRMVDLSNFRGSETLVLFWNPGCGFCQRMLEDLKAWESDQARDAPRLLVVSKGSPEENRAMGLRSLMVLDQSFTAASAFGASGTPMAVLVNAEGKVASRVVAGAEEVLAMARGNGQLSGSSI